MLSTSCIGIIFNLFKNSLEKKNAKNSGLIYETNTYNMYAHTAVADDDEHVANVTFQIQVKLFKAMCANTVGDQLQEKVRI